MGSVIASAAGRRGFVLWLAAIALAGAPLRARPQTASLRAEKVVAFARP